MNNEFLVIIIAAVIIFIYVIYCEALLGGIKDPQKRKKINYYQLENIPSTFVTIGLLGTCIGIFLGLLNFDTDAGKIKQSVGLLLNGLRLSFIITIVGLSFSLIYKRRTNIILNQYGDIQPPDSPELIQVLESNNILKQINIGIKGLNKAFSEELAIKIQQSNEKLAENLSKFGENLAMSNHDALIQALQEIVTDLNSGFKETLGQLVKQNFSELTDSVNSLNNWQKENKAYIEDFANRYKQIVKYTESMNNNLANIVITNADLLSQNSQLHLIVSSLNSVMVEDERFVNTTKNLNQASENFSNNMTNMAVHLQEVKTQLSAIANLRVNIELLNSKLAELRSVDIDEERLYMQGIKQTMASMDEMFKKHYEAIPKIIEKNLRNVQTEK